jgi:hypothetical protein
MAILVVCPACRKSFQVSDKFAGKSGPCPNCKKILQVPDKSQEVTVHAPEEFAGGGRSTSGKLLIKPESFAATKAKPVTVALIVAAVIVVFALAFVGRLIEPPGRYIFAIVGLLALSPALAVAGYAVLRDQELEPYRGKELYIRSSLCALAYVLIWGGFWLLTSRGLITGQLWSWVVVAPAFLAFGGMFGLATLDLDYGDAVFHYSFYLLVTIILRWAAGLHWIWEMKK